MDPRRLVIAGKNHSTGKEGGQLLKRLALRPPIGEVWIRNIYIVAPLLRIGFVKDDQPLRLFIRQRAQQRGVDDAEDCRVRADAERESDDRNPREAGFLQQQSRAIAQVLQQGLHNSSTRRCQMSDVREGALPSLFY